jgi:sodium transport system ATP-binding protein
VTEPEPLVVDGLVKAFEDRRRGRTTAVDGVSFVARRGRVLGLLGPNGAGKTTALRVVAALLRPTAGRVSVFGVDVDREPERARAFTGFLTGAAGLYERATARESTEFFGALHGLDRETARRRTEELAKRFRMEEFLDRPCGRLSDGQRQKTRLARMLVHDPPLLVLDEATAKLDVLVAREVLNFVEEAREAGRAVVFSSHVMGEVERLCDDVVVIHRGRTLFAGETATLRAGGSLEDAFFRLVAAADAAAEAAAGVAPARSRAS